MEGFNLETYMSDLNALIYNHQMKMASIFAQWDVLFKLHKEQILCDTLAESVKNSETGDQKTVQDLMETMAKKKYFEE